jgi:lysyl-tRNA synthetase class 2
MLMTNNLSIQDVLLFPQMKPEKKAEEDSDGKFEELGIPTEWVSVIRKMGITKVEQLKEIKPGKLFNDLCGYNKKNKLGLANPSADEVKQWVN